MTPRGSSYAHPITETLEDILKAGSWYVFRRWSDFRTDRQGKSGLGIEAQRASVAERLNGGNWKLVKEFVEVESGKRTDRPMLDEATRPAELTARSLSLPSWTVCHAMRTSCWAWIRPASTL